MTFKMVLKIFLFLIVSYMTASLDGQTLSGPAHGKAVFCYVGTWAEYRPDAGKFTLEDLKPALCTHIVYAFAALDENTNSIKAMDPWKDLEKDYGEAGFKRAVALKETYPHLKVLIAIGGWDQGSLKFSNMAADPASRETFINSILEFFNEYKFDGLDVNWEYPTLREGKPYDKENFVSLVKELKEAFKPKGYTLTAAIGAGKTIVDVAYDLANLSPHLDYVLMMCYDYHGSWNGVVGANAPLKSFYEEDLQYSIKYMLSHGVAPSKMILGVPMYGRTFILKDPDTKVIEFGKTPVESTGFQGPYTRQEGFMGYNELCTELSNKSLTWKYYWHEASATPYMRDGGRLISYDNPRSIANKVKTVIDYGLGGLMVWSIDTDDFRGVCSEDSDAFVDFIERHKTFADDPVTGEAFKKFNSDDKFRGIQGTAYIVSNGKLELRIPKAESPHYPIMRTINVALTLALEEKRTTDNFFKELIKLSG